MVSDLLVPSQAARGPSGQNISHACFSRTSRALQCGIIRVQAGMPALLWQAGMPALLWQAGMPALRWNLSLQDLDDFGRVYVASRDHAHCLSVPGSSFKGSSQSGGAGAFCQDPVALQEKS